MYLYVATYSVAAAAAPLPHPSDVHWTRRMVFIECARCKNSIKLVIGDTSLLLLLRNDIGDGGKLCTSADREINIFEKNFY